MYNKAKNGRIEVHSTNMNRSLRGWGVGVLVRFGKFYNISGAFKILNAGWVPWSNNSGKVLLKLFDGCK
jgi:hypothetical protein